MEASEPNRVNPVANNIGVISLRLGGLQIHYKTENCLKSKEQLYTQNADRRVALIQYRLLCLWLG